MKNRWIVLAEQLLLTLTLFTVFLLLFSKKLELPYWVQPAGRMHPMMLHFPITLLMLWAVMQVFGEREKFKSQIVFQSIKQLILLAGTLTAGITVVAGIFLSRESAYTSEEITWHKWTGAMLFFLSGMIYATGKIRWTYQWMNKITPVLLITAVMLTGHFGGEITHGKQYVLNPILSRKQIKPVPFDSLQVYNDLVKPLLEKKCISCHNQQKMKGELSLVDTLSLLKGGKTGELFVPGQTATSLLLKRIHLPIEDEHHMPPEGKLQLSFEEMNLLEWWVKNHTNFTQRLNTLPPNDSLVVWAKSRYSNPDAPSYKFRPVDAALLTQLNTSYCSVLPSDRESNALDARLFSKEAYAAKQLEDLKKISEQLVSLSLSKMPVMDDDLKKVATLKNLRKLDLSFTNISTNGLHELTRLAHLEKLSLAGTQLVFKGILNILRECKQLKTVGIWNTGLTDTEMKQLEKSFPEITFLKGYDPVQVEVLKLNPPQLKNYSQVFKDSILVDLKHPIKGTTVRYTTNGKEPDSTGSPMFGNNLILKETTVLNTKAFKAGWYASDAASFGLYKNSFKPDSVSITTPLNAVHQAEGAATFFNGKLGSLGANNPAWANFWAGVRKNEMTVQCFFNQPVRLSSFGLRYMIEESTGIYPPGVVEIWGGKDKNKLKLLGKIIPAIPKKGDAPSMEYGESRFKQTEILHLKIIAHPHVKNKDRHLLLVDEFFLN
jgi:uncharacterized membrane protein